MRKPCIITFKLLFPLLGVLALLARLNAWFSSHIGMYWEVRGPIVQVYRIRQPSLFLPGDKHHGISGGHNHLDAYTQFATVEIITTTSLSHQIQYQNSHDVEEIRLVILEGR
ncbi:hypothetical protein GGS20DRAFT_567359 [Poronia punctata]|nr:hypothetical protein GGS20DRAFT_567359 [Poronia punctata]